MLLRKRSPVLFAGMMLGAATLVVACSSGNNNNTTKVPANNAGAPSAASATGAASPSAAASASATRTGTAAAAPTSAASAAAAGSPAASAPPTDLAPDAQQQLTINLGAEPQYLDPQKSNFQQDIDVEHNLWRGLFFFDKDSNPIPALAAQMPTKDNVGISADGKTFTIKMKTGQKFSDGAPLTAKDMEYSLKRLLNPNTASEYATFYTDIVGGEAYNSALGTKDQPKNPTPDQLAQLQNAVGVKAVDDATIQISLTRPSASIFARLALPPASPMEKAVIDKLGDKDMDVGSLVGNGPFILTEHTPKDHVTLAANPNYTLGSQPYLKKVTFKFIADSVSALNAYRNGELDATAIPPQNFQQVSTDASLKDQVHREIQPGVYSWEYNQAQKPFDNQKVRMAFAKAIDRNALIQVVFGGTGAPSATWLPKGLPGYDATNGDVQKYDVAAAKQLLSDAGFPNGQGLPDIKLLLSDTPTNQLLFGFLQKQLKDNLNVNISADLVDPKTRSSRINSKDFQIIYGGWLQDYPNADDWLPIWTTKDSNNKYNYSDPQYDQAVQNALNEPDPTKSTPLWSAAEKILISDAAVGNLRNPEILTVWKPKVKGWTTTLQDQLIYGDWFLEKVYVSK